MLKLLRVAAFHEEHRLMLLSRGPTSSSAQRSIRIVRSRWTWQIRYYAAGGQPKKKLPASPARTRFAPSPTGYLHLGGLRTALFSYLLAKKTGGQFLLRIEDTDQSRTVPGAEAELCRDLRWAGLQWDEGPDIGGSFGPYRQSERTHVYRDHSNKLLDSGHAYRCFCSSERLSQLAKRRQELGLPTDYDRQCAGVSKEESDDRASHGHSHVVRLKAPVAYPVLQDLVYGKVGKGQGGFNAGITTKHGEVAYEDPILLKSDGNPTYHLANVVDDHFMEITHAIRASEWISSTPKHLALYEAFGWQPPAYAHVGLLVNENGDKLSKRHSAVHVGSYRDTGILPEALLNFVALLGWSHSQKSDVMDLDQLIEQFQMQFTRGNATVSFEKLWYLQKYHAMRLVANESDSFHAMVFQVLECVEEISDAETLQAIKASQSLQAYVAAVIRADARNYTTPNEFTERNIYFFKRPSPMLSLVQEYRSPDGLSLGVPRKAFEIASSQVADLSLEEWKEEMLGQTMKQIVAKLSCDPAFIEGDKSIGREKIWTKALYHEFREALFGGQNGPNMALTMSILGRDETLQRFRQYLDR